MEKTVKNESNVAPTPASTSATSSSTGAPKADHKNRKSLILTTIGFVVVAIAVGLYWLFVLRFEATTNDAYVQGMQVPIVAQTSGNVTEVFFENTDLVHAGDIVVKLDDTNAKLAFESAKNDLASAVRNIQVLYQENLSYKYAIDEKKIALKQAQTDYDHRKGLNLKGAVSVETVQHAQDTLELAQAELEVALQSLKTNEAQLLQTSPEQQPAILSASNNLRDAWIALDRTVIRSPITGYVAKRGVQIGAEISPSSALLSVVPTKPMWVDANFKETQLKGIRIGQPVKVTSDFYGSDVVYQGTVTGLDMGTGSAFSILPAQNATGNWIKVVQRLPVRIDFVSDEMLDKYPLRIGLSMNVNIDIHDESGHVLEAVKRQAPAFQSNVLVPDLTEVNQLIEKIIQENTYSEEIKALAF